MRRILTAALAGLALLSATAHAFDYTSGNFGNVLLPDDSCYAGTVAFIDNGQFKFELRAEGRDALECFTALGDKIAYFHNLTGFDWKVGRDSCTALVSCPFVSIHTFTVAPGVKSEHVLKLREQFRVDEYDRALDTLMRYGPGGKPPER